jgi:putative flippase GtrA
MSVQAGNPPIRQLLGYAVVGIFGTLLDVALYWTCLAAHLWPWAAVTIAFGTATLCQFWLNRHYSFRAFDRPARLQIVPYIGVSVAQWLLTVVTVEWCIGSGHLSPLLAKAIAIPPTALGGFLVNRAVTFAPHRKATDSPGRLER